VALALKSTLGLGDTSTLSLPLALAPVTTPVPVAPSADVANLYGMLAANGPQTTTPGQYFNVTPTATGQTTGSDTTVIAIAAGIAALLLFSGGKRRR
jgi:hypothetical protein